MIERIWKSVEFSMNISNEEKFNNDSLILNTELNYYDYLKEMKSFNSFKKENFNNSIEMISSGFEREKENEHLILDKLKHNQNFIGEIERLKKVGIDGEIFDILERKIKLKFYKEYVIENCYIKIELFDNKIITDINLKIEGVTK